MEVRAPADYSSSMPLTCESALPQNAEQVLINNEPLKLKSKSLKKVLVIGDTGCRLKGKNMQSCDDPNSWPFKQLANSAAGFNADLIIHVGDYLYRETPCAPSDKGCSGSVYGNNFKTLDADFFTPAKSLLTKAPWFFVRGNHESCKRAGPLWFRFFDPFPYTGKCSETAEIYAVNFKNVDLINVDSSDASDYSPKKSEVEKFKAQFAKLPKLKNPWLVSHRPLYGIKILEDDHEDDRNEEDEAKRLPIDLSKITVKELEGRDLVSFNQTLQAALPQSLSENLALSLAGHFHNLEILNFNGKLTPQIISGNGSSKLEENVTESLNGLSIQDAAVISSKFWHGFGFLTMEEKLNGWKITEYDPQGKKILSCELQDRVIECD